LLLMSQLESQHSRLIRLLGPPGLSLPLKTERFGSVLFKPLETQLIGVDFFLELSQEFESGFFKQEQFLHSIANFFSFRMPKILIKFDSDMIVKWLVYWGNQRTAVPHSKSILRSIIVRITQIFTNFQILFQWQIFSDKIKYLFF